MTRCSVVLMGMMMGVLAVSMPAYAENTVPQQVIPQDTIQVKMSMAPVVKNVTPAVVNIYTKHVVSQQVLPFFGNPLFQEFFGGTFALQMPERVENSLGSGVIVRADGLVVTNAHVAENAVEIRVVLSDRREYPAELVLVDRKADIALLKIDAKDTKNTKGASLPFLSFADSDKAEVGDLVLAVGNPFGVGQTVSSGIISALARTSVNKKGIGYYIQTDAAINPGNSGGALVDMQGRVIGINTMIFSKTGGYMGIGFAVPSNLVTTVVDAYAHDNGKSGRVRRPWFGADMQTVTSDIAATLGMERPQGVLVQKVYPTGPAAKAGLKQGDLLLSLDGKPVDDFQTVYYILATQRVGGSLPITYQRNGKEDHTRLALELPIEHPKRQVTEMKGNHPLAGASLANLSPALSVELDDGNLPMEGVVVMKVTGVSARLGLRESDVILSVNGQKVDSVDQAQRILNKKAAAWRIEIMRSGKRMTIQVRA